MVCVIPVPLMTLFTAKELETMVNSNKSYLMSCKNHNCLALHVTLTNLAIYRFAVILIYHYSCSDQSLLIGGFPQMTNSPNGSGRFWSHSPTKSAPCFFASSGAERGCPDHLLTSGEETSSSRCGLTLVNGLL